MLKIKKRGKKTRVKIFILVIESKFNLEIIKAMKKANMQKGNSVLYSKIPKNLFE